MNDPKLLFTAIAGMLLVIAFCGVGLYLTNEIYEVPDYQTYTKEESCNGGNTQ